jgi:hypothetical protein
MTYRDEAARITAVLAGLLGHMPTDEDDDVLLWFTLGWAAGSADRDHQHERLSVDGEPISRPHGSKPGDWVLG